MPLEKEYITTEADRLLALLQQRREISIEEAAKVLTMSVRTVESYANFFEEEGLIGINYKFTTPFLTIKEVKTTAPEIKFTLEPEKKSVGGIFLRRIGEDFNILKLKLRSGELYLLKEKYPEMIKNLREILKGSESGLSVKNTNELQFKLNEVNVKLDEAIRSLNEDKADVARSNFFFIEQELARVFEQMQGGTPAASALSLPEPTRVGSDLSPLIEEIKAAAGRGDFEKGERLLKQLQQAYKSMPQEYREREERMKQDLEVLERDFSIGQADHLSKEMEDKSTRIHHFLAIANKALERGQLSEAIVQFNRIKELYLGLPKGFVQERIGLNREIIGLFRSISAARSATLDDSFVTISTNMEQKLTEIREHLAQNKFNDAIQAYNEAVELFGKLPDIKAPVKNNLKNYLLLIFERLSAAKEEFFAKNLKDIIAEIYRELGRAVMCLEHKDFKTANLHYAAALTTYKTIPRGYTESLLPVHERLMEFYQRFSLGLEQESSSEFQAISAEINSEIERLTKLIQGKAYEESLGLYQRIMIMYNRLPGGFIKEKAAMRKQLTVLSHSITGEIDDIVLKGVPPDVRETYHELLRYIALFYMHVESHRLNLVSIDYRQIRRLVDRLPYGLITGSKLISKELKEISGEVDVIGQVKQLAQLVELGYSTKSKELFATIISKIDRLDKTKPEVRGLYEYVKGIMVKKPKKVVLLPNKDVLQTELPRVEPLKKPEVAKPTVQKEGAIPRIQPLTGNEEQDLIRIASRGQVGQASVEFEKLKGVLQRDIIATITSRKREMVINNKISMARMFLEFGKKERAQELLREALLLDPDNKPAKMLQALVGA